jgi:hypothetical protein
MCENLKNLLKEKEKEKEIELEETENLPFSLMPIIYRKITNKELLHSEIIATLISDSSGNNKSREFLKLFLCAIGVQNDSFGDFKNLKVDTEYTIKNRRRIDILITWSNYAVIIENKLNNAPDLDNQLMDYVKAIEGKEIIIDKESKKVEVLKTVYLPLLQTKKANLQIDNKKIEVVNFYPKDIIEWLKKCCEKLDKNQAEAVACSNYITLLKYINQINHNLMETKKILKKFKNKELKQLVNAAKIVNSKDWEHGILDKLEKLIKEENKEIKTKIEPYKANRSFLQLWWENYKFWVEIYISEVSFNVYAVNRGDKNDSDELFNNFDFNFHSSEADSSGLKQFYKLVKEGKFQYNIDFSGNDNESNKKLVEDIIELLKRSI